MALTRRALRNLAPLPPAVVTEPLLEDGQAPRQPSARELAEDWLQAQAVLEQRLSRKLAHVYRRNVVCAANLDPNMRVEQHEPEGRKLAGNGAPRADYMRTGGYWRMAVSIAMARHLLARDGGGSAGP